MFIKAFIKTITMIIATYLAAMRMFSWTRGRELFFNLNRFTKRMLSRHVVRVEVKSLSVAKKDRTWVLGQVAHEAPDMRLL